MPNGRAKNWIRLCMVMEGFRLRHGHWPTRVRLPSACLANLREDLFTPQEFAQLSAKIALVAEEVPMTAEDEAGARYTTGEEVPPVAAWLGVEPRPGPAEDEGYDV
jgi:hypothetical protein